MNPALLWNAVLVSCATLLLPQVSRAALPAKYQPYIIDSVETAKDSARLRDAVNSSVIDGLQKQPARVAASGGGFAYEFQIDDANVPQSVVVQYSGENKPNKGENLLFRILADNTPIYIEGLNRNKAGRLFEVSYALPPEALHGKKQIKVRFEAFDPKSVVGQIYAVAVVREKTRTGFFDDLRSYEGLSAGWTCNVPGTFVYTEPEGAGGRPLVNDSAIDGLDYYGVRLNLDIRGMDRVPLDVFVSTNHLKPASQYDEGYRLRKAGYLVEKRGNGPVSITIPFADFDNPQALRGHMRNLRSIAFRFWGEKTGQVRVISAELLHGHSVYVNAPLRGKPAEPGKPAEYKLTVTNTEKVGQTVSLSFQRYGFEAMESTVTPQELRLNPGQSGEVTVSVKIPEELPMGGREEQLLQIRPSADSSAEQTVRFVTVRAYPHPFVIHTKEGWDEVRANAEKYDWARARKVKYLKDADGWGVPPRAAYLANVDGDPFVVPINHEVGLINNAYAWQLSREKRYAERVREFLLMLSDYRTGYPLTLKAGHQGTVHEGGFFQHVVEAYDLILDSGVLSEADQAQITNTLRLYMDRELKGQFPEGANWAVAQLAGAFYCALVMQDFERVDFSLYAPSMLVDKLRTYVMPDGWWNECTISYNSWCTAMFSKMGLALQPFGYSFLTDRFPVNFSRVPEPERSGTPEERVRKQREVNHGHSFVVRGSINQPYITIQMLADALLPHIDYRGVMFGVNDSNEINVAGQNYELAYYAFRDPRYAAVIKLSKTREDLIYGVPELPETDFQLGSSLGAFSDNAGLITLRSTQKEPRERIQAVLEYGTHGGYHGHFDRVSLNSVMRYGRSFYNPKMVFYIYAPFMYNFYCQSSVTKNMVAVDLKQQEADESVRRLFHTGKLFQAGAVEGTAAWSYPAYGGLRGDMKTYQTFEQKAFDENRFVPIPKNHPDFGVETGFTEPVMQRRLMAVTDDYVLIADYDASTAGKPHRFDQLFHVQGLLGLSAPEKSAATHHPQLSEDPLGAAQFVTDINNYEVEGTLTASFLTKFGPGFKKGGMAPNGEPGDLYMNLHYAWPNGKRTAFTGHVAEHLPVERRLEYSVKGDGKILADGTFGAWILGAGKIDVDLKGVETLEMEARLPRGRSKVLTLFWAGPVIETGDGKTIKLSELQAQKTNVQENSNGLTRDYENGPIKIAGNVCEWGLPAEPANCSENAPSVYRYDLKGLQAARLKCVVGGDYSVGDETHNRTTIGVTTEGTSARYLTVMEPFEKPEGNVIAAVEATSPDDLTVKFKDGREHRVTLVGMQGDGKSIGMTMREYKGDMLIREETAP